MNDSIHSTVKEPLKQMVPAGCMTTDEKLTKCKNKKSEIF